MPLTAKAQWFDHLQGLGSVARVNPDPVATRRRQTPINGEDGPGEFAALLDLAPKFCLNRAEAASIVDSVFAATSMWRSVAAGLGISQSEIDLFNDAFELHRRAAARVQG